MADILNFPKKDQAELSPELKALTDTIVCRMNEYKAPNFSLSIPDDDALIETITEAVTEYDNQWRELVMRAALVAVEETIRSGITRFE